MKRGADAPLKCPLLFYLAPPLWRFDRQAGFGYEIIQELL